jgi:CPA1 family monovalent cation:H+ antiporter
MGQQGGLMHALHLATALVCLAAAFGVLNHFLLKLPQAIGMVVIALASSLALMLVDLLVPQFGIDDIVRREILGIDFSEALLQGMLGFLLFAGALQVDFESLRDEKWPVALTASLGVLFSTAAVGVGFHLMAAVPFTIALVFGALISPTDPVAVLGLLKAVKVPKALETRIAGESLFNDGTAYVVFLIVAAVAFSTPEGEPVGALGALRLFVVEAGGGALFGALCGWVVFQAMRRIDDYALEVLLTFALVMGCYALAAAIHVSGPIAVVVAGLLIGHSGMKHGMSERTRQHVDAFWRLIDEILNAVLFLLIGFEVFALSFDKATIGLGLLAIPLVILARFVSVGIFIGLLGFRRRFTPGTVPIMTWGGLRGGISVALVLSLPASHWQPLLLTATYVVVIFSIVVQGLTMERVVRRFLPDGA